MFSYFLGVLSVEHVIAAQDDDENKDTLSPEDSSHSSDSQVS